MSSVWFPALLILVAGAIAYGVVMVVDAIVGRRRRKLHGKRRGPQWRRRLPVALVVGAIVSLLFAFGQVRIDREVTAGTVVLAIDVSHSMGSADVQPNRLAAAQVAARAFLDRLPAGFRVGLATFSISSSVPVLPTADRSRVATALMTLAVDTGTGTVIGDGLSSAVDAIQADRGDAGERPAAVVLLSDGQDSGSTIPPVQAAARAADLGIPVYTVAIGEATTGVTGTVGVDRGDAGCILRRPRRDGGVDRCSVVHDQHVRPAHPGLRHARLALVVGARDRRERRPVRDRGRHHVARRDGSARDREPRPLRLTDL